MPGFIEPQLATLKMKAPSGSPWIHEVKYDGYRIQLRIDGDDRRAYTRNGYNWVNKFSRIAGAFGIEGQAIVDGEVVVIHDGRTNFSELQADLGRGDQDRLVYFAFDLLWLDGRDVRKEPQIERKRLLKDLIEKHDLKEPVIYSEHHEGDGQALFAAASRLNYEGIVSKRVDAPTDRIGRRFGRRSRSFRRESFPWLASSRTHPAWPRSIWARRKARIWSTWERSGRDGAEPPRRRSARRSTPW